MSEHRWYRIVQPANADRLCRLSAPAEVVQCPATSMHQRAGRYLANPSVSAMPRKRFVPAHFCYSWAWRYLASAGLVEALGNAGLTGFTAGPLDTAAQPSARGFLEFRIQWNGELVADPAQVHVSDYCADCGLISFDVLSDPPWGAGDLDSRADFFYLAPRFAAFCSQRAYRAMKRICGDEFQAVPALQATGQEDSLRATSFSWPCRGLPGHGGDPRRIWDGLLGLDPRGILPRRMPEPAR